MSEGNIAAAERTVEEAWNKGNLAAIDELSADNFVGHDPAVGDFDTEGGKAIIASYRGAFPDLHMSIEDIFESGDKVVTRWHSEGTFTGELMGLKPTGEKGDVTGITIDRFEAGKIAESWTQWDNLQLMRDIGAIPSEVQSPA